MDKNRVKCNMCDWEGSEEDLVRIDGDIIEGALLEIIYACPICKDDAYLIDEL